MPRGTSFAEVSQAVTKKTTLKSEVKKRVNVTQPEKKKRFPSKEPRQCPNFSCLEDIQDKTTKDELAESATTTSETNDPDFSTGWDDIKTDQVSAECVVLLEDEGSGTVLQENLLQDDNDNADEEEEDKRSENEANQKLGKAKKLSKKQLRLQKEKLEEEREREERQKRREERRRKKELQAKLVEEEKPQSFDEAAYKASVYTTVQASMELIMPQGEITITVDNLTPLMKGLGLDTGDEAIKDLILDALLNSYGKIDPHTLDQLVLNKQLQEGLEDLENCVDAAFEVLDQDGDGLITARDLYRLMIHIGEVMWDDQVEAMLRTADVDGDGKISKKDLFLFLIGQEKSVKLEDQILNKNTNSAGGEDDLKPVLTDSTQSDLRESGPQIDSDFLKTSSLQSDIAKDAWTDTATSKLTPTAVASSEDLQAAERRRKIFSGYSRAEFKSPRASASLQVDHKSDPDKTPSLTDHEDDGTLPKPGSETVKSANTNLGDGEVENTRTVIQKHTDGTSAIADNFKQMEIHVSGAENAAADPKLVLPSVSRMDGERELESSAGTDDEDNKQTEGFVRTTVTESEQEDTNLESGDRLDSSHVCSDEYEDTLTDRHDEQLELPSTPLTLEKGISLLPSPEFEPVASPLSPHPPSSRLSSLTPSPRTRRRRFVFSAGRPDSPLQAEVSTKRQDAQRAFRLSLDHLIPPGLHPDLADLARDSQDNSGPDEEKDALPQMSQQNLKEIEEQVLQTTQALEAKTARSPEARAREKVVFMIGTDDNDEENDDAQDERESVVESVLYPVYVAPCAREARSELKLPSVEITQDHSARGYSAEGLGILSQRNSMSRPADFPGRVSDIDLNLLEDEDYAYSLGDIVDKTSLSLGSSQSVSTIIISVDIADHVSSLHDDDDVSDSNGFEENHIDVKPSDVLQKKTPKEKLEVSTGEEEKDTRYSTQRHAASRVRVASDSSRMLKSRQQQSSIRRSLTCHMVTLKDLSPSTPTSPHLSPRDVNRMKRGLSSPRLHSFSPCRRDPSLNGKESSATQRDPDDSKLKPPITHPEPPSTKPWQGMPSRRAASLNRTKSPAARGDSCRFYSPSARGMNSFRTPRLDSPESYRSQRFSPRSPGSPSRHHSRLESVGTGQHFSRKQKEAWGRSQHSYRESSPLAKTDVSTGRSSEGTTHQSVLQKTGGSRQMKEKFYGPNFEVIMSQKGEPEDLLQKSLFVDSPRSTRSRQPLADDQSTSRNDSPVSAGGRRVLISKQLERVKEMEIRITQRRQHVDVHNNGDLTMKKSADPPSGLHRSRTASNFASSNLTEAEQSLSRDSRDSAQEPRHKIRPSSCSSLRRTRRMAFSDSLPMRKVHTPEVSEAVRSTKPQTVVSKPSSQRAHRPQQCEPTIKVINMDPLLNDVNDQEDPQDQPDKPGKRRRRSIFKPLARMLLLYEKARRRQAALAGTNGNASGTAVSISRQLQQGIPYRPPTPPQHSPSLSLTSSPRKAPEPFQDRFEDCSYARNPVDSSPKNSLSRNASFVLGGEKETTVQGESGMTKQDLLFGEEMQSTHDLLTERLTSLRAQRNMTPSFTFEFPESSVCVVKPKPVNKESNGS